MFHPLVQSTNIAVYHVVDTTEETQTLFRRERVTARVTDKKYTQMTRIKMLPKCHISNLSKKILNIF